VKFALFGHGRMGRVVAEHARRSGHEIGVVLTSRDAALPPDGLAERLKNHDAGLDFSVPQGIVARAEACARAGVPLVTGTTGWHAERDAVRRAVERSGGALVHGANFSPGVHVLYRLVARAGELFGALDGYDAFIQEAHHAAKRDAPSGTAVRLREILARPLGKEVPVASTRAGHIPGIHRVGFDSTADTLVLVHTARSREAFAMGALVAARWVQGRRGMFAFEDVMEDIMTPKPPTPGDTG
jgi:4-hydroxy-tetrahydrodipicolinate reductase